MPLFKANGILRWEEESRSKTVTRDLWFKTINSVCGLWDRRDDHHLILSFLNYRTGFEAEGEIRAVGGEFMSMDQDKKTGRTFCIVREPKNLEPMPHLGIKRL